jgi:hypothetical protein
MEQGVGVMKPEQSVETVSEDQAMEDVHYVVWFIGNATQIIHKRYCHIGGNHDVIQKPVMCWCV